MERWLARVRHDLVKHAAWRARDLAAAIEAGEAVRAGDGAALRRAVLELADGEGRRAGLVGAWRWLRADFLDELPGEVDEERRARLAVVLDGFEAEIGAIEARVRALGDEEVSSLCAAVRSIEGAVERMAHDVNGALGG